SSTFHRKPGRISNANSPSAARPPRERKSPIAAHAVPAAASRNSRSVLTSAPCARPNPYRSTSLSRRPRLGERRAYGAKIILLASDMSGIHWTAVSENSGKRGGRIRQTSRSERRLGGNCGLDREIGHQDQCPLFCDR